MRRLAAALAPLLLLTATPAYAADGDPLARLDTRVTQAIVVTASDWTASHATLTAYARTGDGWKRVIAPTPARIGSTGMVPAAKRRQDTGKTPAGTFAIPAAFGRKPDPGTRLPYVHLDRNDAWPYWRGDPSTYNLLQTAPHDWTRHGKFVERLWSKGRQYDYVAVMDYNLPDGPTTTGADGVVRTSRPANTRKGGGIFLHVTNGRSTAGCIAIPEDVMVRILRWLDPEANPVIITRVSRG